MPEKLFPEASDEKAALDADCKHLVKAINSVLTAGLIMCDEAKDIGEVAIVITMAARANATRTVPVEAILGATVAQLLSKMVAMPRN